MLELYKFAYVDYVDIMACQEDQAKEKIGKEEEEEK